MAEEVKQTELRDYIKDHVDLQDYIETFYPQVMFKGNKVKKTVCPFPQHSEKTGSFSIVDGEQTYKCFGCGESGDIFTFVQMMEGVDFLEAMEIIAQNQGYTVIKGLSTLPNNQKKYMDSVKTHNIRYIKNLKENKEALKYLQETRRLSIDTIKAFKLGVTDLKEHKWRENLRGKIDNSITFPLFLNTPHEEAIANAYKSLDSNTDPKYINDSSGQVNKMSNGYDFVKSDLLYGYPQAYKTIRAEKFVYVVEGYFDVIAMHEANLKNTVGIMCATLSDNQVLAIKKLCKKVILMLDNDLAGGKGKIKAIEKLLENGIEVEVFESKDLKDADDICKKNLFITEYIKKYISDRTYNAITYYINETILQYETALFNAQMKAYKEGANIISKISDDVERQFHLCRLKKRLDMK